VLYAPSTAMRSLKRYGRTSQMQFNIRALTLVLELGSSRDAGWDSTNLCPFFRHYPFALSACLYPHNWSSVFHWVREDCLRNSVSDIAACNGRVIFRPVRPMSVTRTLERPPIVNSIPKCLLLRCCSSRISLLLGNLRNAKEC
jgi:hypothetical protein